MLETIQNVCRKIAGFFIAFFSILWVTMVALVATGDHTSPINGAEINGILVFLLWSLCVYIIIKGHPLFPAITSTVALIIVYVLKFGVSDQISSLFELVFTGIAIYGVLGLLLRGAIKERIQESEDTKKRIGYAEENGIAHCPYCGSPSIDYFPLGIPIEDGEDIIRSSNTYHCKRCGREWW